MFGLNVEARVARHLNVFQKAVDGLNKVRADIKKEVASRIEKKQKLVLEIRTH